MKKLTLALIFAWYLAAVVLALNLFAESTTGLNEFDNSVIADGGDRLELSDEMGVLSVGNLSDVSLSILNGVYSNITIKVEDDSELIIPSPAVIISVVTNVTTTDNGVAAHRASSENGGILYGCLVLGCTENHDLVAAQPAWKRTETTEAVETRTLTFEWDGEQYTAKRERVLWTKVKRFVKNETWEVSDDKPVK